MALGTEYILDERKAHRYDKKIIILKQRMLIIFNTITGFLILSYRPDEITFEENYLILGAGAIVFLIFCFVLTSVVYKKSCHLLWNGVFFLLSVSFIMLTRLNYESARKQILWAFLGMIFAFVIPLVFTKIKDLQKFKLVYLVTGLILVILPLIIGNVTHGALNWITIGPVRFQPSEVVKILFVFYFAVVFSEKLTLKQLILPIIIGAAFVLILVVETDLGGALIFFITFVIMMYVSTGNEFLFFLSLSAFSGASFIAYKIFDHIKVRVAAYLNPWADFFGKGNQILHSLFSIYTWGLLGSGLTRGMPNRVPVVDSDFILAAIGEEFGIIYMVCIMGIYTFVYYRGINISLRCKSKFYSLIALGLSTILVFQAFLIMGGVIKFIPLTGVTLPFVSYGGTSVLISIIMIGILQTIFSVGQKEEIPLESEPKTKGDFSEYVA